MTQTTCDADEDVIADQRTWLLKVAGEMTLTLPSYTEDLAQEGHIAMWQAAKVYDPSKGMALRTWIRNKARYRMLDCIVRRNWTRSTEMMGYHRSSISVKEHAAEFVGDIINELGYTDTLGNIEVAYHTGQIMEALNALSPKQREYVVRRFWGDEQPKALQREADGVDQWCGIKKRLRVSLKHLAELAE